MSSPFFGSGQLKSYLKPGAEHQSGLHGAVLGNVRACTRLAQLIRTAYGPNGMSKMIVTKHDQLRVTADSGVLFDEIQVVHPAAQLVAQAGTMQDKEYGDGSDLVVILSGELLTLAGSLLRMGLHVSALVAGYTRAAALAAELQSELVVSHVPRESLRERAAVLPVIRTAVEPKCYDSAELLAGLVTDACLAVCPAESAQFDVDRVRVVKAPGGHVADSTLMHGIALATAPVGTVKRAHNPRIAVYSCAIDAAQTETRGVVLLETAAELLQYSRSEEAALEHTVRTIAEAGVTVLVAGAAFGELAVHYLNKYRILGVRVASRWDLRRLCVAVGARALTRLAAPAPDDLGRCEQVAATHVGETLLTVFRRTPPSDSSVGTLRGGTVATIVVRAANQALADDMERAIDDGVNAYKTLTRAALLGPAGAALVAGAGAFEMALRARLLAAAAQVPGLAQYAIRAFANALEVVPRTIAENAGIPATRALPELEAAHISGNSQAGVDVGHACIMSATGPRARAGTDLGIFDPLLIKAHAIKLAAETAVTILNIDHVIMSRPEAFSPGLPPQDGAWDDTDAAY